MNESEEIEFKDTKSFTAGSRIPFIRISKSTNNVNISVAAASGMDLRAGDMIKLSKSKAGSIYIYKETVPDTGGVRVCKVNNTLWRTSVKQLPSQLFELFAIKEKSYRLFIEITGEQIIVKDKFQQERIVTGFRVMNIPELNKE